MTMLGLCPPSSTVLRTNNGNLFLNTDLCPASGWLADVYIRFHPTWHVPYLVFGFSPFKSQHRYPCLIQREGVLPAHALPKHIVSRTQSLVPYPGVSAV